MNILITTLGSYGDVYPKVGLAIKLKQRGHRVTLFTNPFYAELARKYEIDFVPIGTLAQYERFANHPDLFDPRQSVRVFFDELVVSNISVAYERLRVRSLLTQRDWANLQDWPNLETQKLFLNEPLVSVPSPPTR